jgi:hypothetical protein
MGFSLGFYIGFYHPFKRVTIFAKTGKNFLFINKSPQLNQEASKQSLLISATR